MAKPEAQEAAAKERIVNHMNKDHTDSVSASAAVEELNLISIGPPIPPGFQAETLLQSPRGAPD